MAKLTKSPDRILTVIEGRPENINLVKELQVAAIKRDWKFLHLTKINSDNIARFDFSNTSLDYVIFRELTGNNYYETERIMDWLQFNQKIGLNLNVAGGRMSTSDKHYQQGLFLLDPFLKKYALPTFEAKTKANVLSYVGAGRVRYPFVIKPRRGTTGDGIILIHDRSDLDKIPNFRDMLIEQYVKPECDFRVFVIGGVAVGAMRKVGDFNDPGNFKIWCAGREKTTETDLDTIEILSKIATHAAAVSGLEYAGIDIIKESETNKYYILETNIAASWSVFSPVTNINIPDLILDWFEDRDDARRQPINESIQRYINNRKKYLSRETLKNYEAILKGEKGITDKIKTQFKHEKAKYLYDTGYLFNQLAAAYEDIADGGDATKYSGLIDSIEHMPLSWTGNFIGPECGTLEDGAILSALYLYILGKMRKV